MENKSPVTCIIEIKLGTPDTFFLEQEIDKLTKAVAYPVSDFMRGYSQALVDVKRFLSQQKPVSDQPPSSK